VKRTSGEHPPGARRLRFEPRCLPPGARTPKIERVSRILAAGLGALASACTPEIQPRWLVGAPRELALEVEVIAQGPYGSRITPGPRSARDALPLDTLSLRPVVVDPDGPLDPDELEGAWFLCSDVGNCLLGRELAERPRCTGAEIQPSEPCRFGDAGAAMLTIADFPTPLSLDQSTVFELVRGPTVAFMGSPPDGPGIDACIARFDGQTRLDGCLLMERLLGIGPLGELVAGLIALGVDPGLFEGAETLLAQPRNHNPAIEQFRVAFGDASMLVPAGGMVTVPRDETIMLTVETTPADLDGFEVMEGEVTVLLTDDLSTEWWFDREVDVDDALPGQLEVRWRAGAVTGTVRAYAALRDSRHGEAWGWLSLRIEG
jgi:hypothetical protein